MTLPAAKLIRHLDALGFAELPPAIQTAARRVLAAHHAGDLVGTLGLDDAAAVPRVIHLDDGRVRYVAPGGRFSVRTPWRRCWSCGRQSLTPDQRSPQRCTWCTSRPDVRARLVSVGGGFRVACSCGWTLSIDGDRLAAHKVRADHEAAQHPGYWKARNAFYMARLYVSRHPHDPEAARRRQDAAAARDAALVATVERARAGALDWPAVADLAGIAVSSLVRSLNRAGAVELANECNRAYRASLRSRQEVAA